jgi:hypothetical protein
MAKGREEIANQPIIDIDDKLREYMAKNAPVGGYQLPTGYLSNSQIDMYLKCPMQYYHRYVCDNKRPPGVAITLGSGTHKAAEVTHHHIVDHDVPAPIEQVVAAFSDHFDKKSEDVPAEDWKEDGINKGQIKDAGIQLVSIYNRVVAPKVKPQVKDGVRGIEKKLEINVEGIPLVGYIDLIDTNADAIMSEEERALLRQYGSDVPEIFRTAIADFKTRTKSISEDEVKGSLQLTIYSYAEQVGLVRYDQFLRQKTPKVKRIHSMRTTQDYKWMAEIITGVARAITAGVFPPCDPTSWACTPKWCGYYYMCRGKAR